MGGRRERAGRQAQSLWERFRSARNELRKRSDAYLAENLEKKRGLCAQVAGLAESTAWNETAELIKRLQAEWKEIGPVSTRHAQALWREFRAPCDTFFVRRKEHFARLDGERRTAATERPRELSLQEMALALRDRLATNTIGGQSTSTTRDTAREVERISASWALLGPVLDDDARALAERFARARDRALVDRGA